MQQKNTTYNKELGNKGEDIASSFFKRNGFQIINRNFRFGKIGEIDLIAKKGDLVVFAEVKRRSSSIYGGAYYSITDKKKQTLKKVARHFLRAYPLFFSKDFTYRFDLIAIENGRVEWIEDIVR